MAKRESEIVCAVCGEAGDGGHFGAETCRACAAFFRRTVALQKKYVCRQSRNCEIRSPVRCACRSCRFNKCLEVGMKESAVQKNRDAIGSRSEEPSTSQLNYNSSASSPENYYDYSPQHSRDLNSNMPNLWRIQENYVQLDSIRKVIHSNSGSNMFTSRPPKAVNYKECHMMTSSEIGLTRDFLDSSYPEFEKLPIEQKNVLFKNFYASFLFLECGYFSVVHNRTDRIILASGDYIDYTRLDNFYKDEEKKQKMSTQDAINLFGPSFEVYRRNIIEPMHKHGVKDLEFFAILSFALWDIGLEGETADTEEIAERIRNNVSRELVYFYQNVLRDPDYGVRLTNLLVLLQTAQRAVRRFQEDTEISHVFNAYIVDDTLYKLING